MVHHINIFSHPCKVVTVICMKRNYQQRTYLGLCISSNVLAHSTDQLLNKQRIVSSIHPSFIAYVASYIFHAVEEICAECEILPFGLYVIYPFTLPFINALTLYFSYRISFYFFLFFSFLISHSSHRLQRRFTSTLRIFQIT